MTTKARLIDGILHLNRSARRDWLDRFDIPALTRYLDHLQHAMEPRGRESVWFRDGETAAAMTRKPAA
jgi:hypothetical protein